MAGSKAAAVAEKVVAVAVGSYAGQAAADFSGAQATRNGVGVGVGVTLLGAAGWIFGGPRSFVRTVGEGLALGGGAWLTGVAGQHMDQAILTASKGGTTTTAAEQNAAAVRRAQVAQAAAMAAQRATAAPVAPMSSGRSVNGGSGGRPVETYQYPED